MQIHVEAKLFIFLIAQLTSSLHGYSEILVLSLSPNRGSPSLSLYCSPSSTFPTNYCTCMFHSFFCRGVTTITFFLTITFDNHIKTKIALLIVLYTLWETGQLIAQLLTVGTAYLLWPGRAVGGAAVPGRDPQRWSAPSGPRPGSSPSPLVLITGGKYENYQKH